MSDPTTPSASTDPAAYFDASEFAVRGDLEDTHYWHLHRREVLLRELARVIAPGGPERLVEVGCGLGTVATHLNAAGYRVDYVDVFDEALVRAEQRARARLGAGADGLRFLRADVTADLPVKDVDGVLLLDVIEHLPDDVGALARARRALRPGRSSFVLVTVPAFSFLWSPWDDMERHKRRYTRPRLDAALRAAGLEPVRSTYFFFPLFFAALAVKGARAARGLAARATGRAPAPPRDIRDMAEATSNPLLDRLMLAVTAPERAFLPAGRLPLGTSLLTLARPA